MNVVNALLIPDSLIDDARYRAALDWLYGLSLVPKRLPAAQQRAAKFARVGRLLWLLGDPHRAFPAVVVVGTKGKGSTAAMLSEILRAGGWRVGRYTQPHLLSWRERIWVDGANIEPGEAAELIEAVRPFAEQVQREAPHLGQLTTFEVGSTVAFLYFQRRAVDLAVVEAGVGGLGDVSNLTRVEAVALAPVSLDHTAVLGTTVAAIAREKAAVIRPRGLAVSAPQSEEARAVIAAQASACKAVLWQVGLDWRWCPADDHPGRGRFDVEGPDRAWLDLSLPLLGRHQRDNATVAVATAALLERIGFGVPPAAVRRGLASVDWPGRLQVLPGEPRLVLDGAHNGDSARRLAEALRECFGYRRLWLVLGMTAGKDVAGVAAALVPLADEVIVTRSSHPHALSPADLAAHLRQLGSPVRQAPDVASALAMAVSQAARDDLVCVTGSLFLVGEALERTALACPNDHVLWRRPAMPDTVAPGRAGRAEL